MKRVIKNLYTLKGAKATERTDELRTQIGLAPEGSTSSEFIEHSLATAANDFLVASGTGVFAKQTLAQTKTTLGLGTAAYTAATAYVTHSLATAANDFLVASGNGAFVKQTLAQVKTTLGIEITDITYANLATAIGASTLVPGRFYKITDYKTVHWIKESEGDYVYDDSQESEGTKTVVTGTVEPLVVFAVAVNKLALEAYSITYPTDKITYEPLITNWTGLGQFYDTDHVIDGFTGIITYREDTVNCLAAPFDWRVLEYEGSVKTFGNNCHDIIIPLTKIIPFIIIGDDCSTMTFGSSCNTMTFGSGCGTMTFGSSCNTMTFGSNCQLMTFGSGCQLMTFGSNCYTMTFGSGCGTMTFGSGCNTMTFGSVCNTMTFPDYTAFNDFKDGVVDVDFTLGTVEQITDGSTVTHQRFGSAVVQSYLTEWSSGGYELVFVENAIGVFED